MKKFEKIVLYTAVECYTDNPAKVEGITALDALIPLIGEATTITGVTLLDYDAEEYELVKKSDITALRTMTSKKRKEANNGYPTDDIPTSRPDYGKGIRLQYGRVYMGPRHAEPVPDEGREGVD